MPVVDDLESKRLVGMITDRDICCRVTAKGLDPATTSVGAVLSPNVMSCRPDDEIEEAERKMRESQVRRIVVVDEDGRCCGVVAQADIARTDAAKAGDVVQAVSRPAPRKQVSRAA
jgi:CBS domain-containing protein